VSPTLVGIAGGADPIAVEAEVGLAVDSGATLRLTPSRPMGSRATSCGGEGDEMQEGEE
jgi:hypothetical protein